jgi:hypothetical protein
MGNSLRSPTEVSSGRRDRANPSAYAQATPYLHVLQLVYLEVARMILATKIRRDIALQGSHLLYVCDIETEELLSSISPPSQFCYYLLPSRIPSFPGVKPLAL